MPGIETVRHSVVEPLPVFLELDKVRRAAIHHAAEMGVDQVLGRTIESSRKAVIDLRDEVANNRYSEIQSSNSGGYVRYKLEQEQIIKLQGNDALKLDVSVAVCIPKTEEQLREDEEARRRKLRPPQQIPGDSAVFFNPSTGTPNVWYWRSPEGQYEFFDNSGFHPATGEELVPITKEVAMAWRLQSEQVKLARIAGDKCDELAANPYDLQRPRELHGVKLSILRLNADEAVVSCETALAQEPKNLRYAYQLGRALHSENPDAAIRYYTKATRGNYAAAFDNLGWSLIKKNKRAEGKAILLQGADLGDPSCMYSLADIGEREAKTKGNIRPDRRVMDLYRQAAELGHAEARQRLKRSVKRRPRGPQDAERRRLEQEEARAAWAQQSERRRREQAEAAEMFFDILGSIIRR